MRFKKGIVLFEVAFVVLLVSIISLFLFKGYSLFIKAGRKSLDYLNLVLLCEEKNWDLEIKERNNKINEELEKEGDFDTPSYNWQLNLENIMYSGLEDSENSNLKKGILKVNHIDKRRVSLDMTLYLWTKE